MNTVSSIADSAGISQPPVVRITPPGRWWILPLAELWAYRELIYFFVWRDIKVRYKQTAIGAAWAVLQPLLTMIVFSLFFGRLAHIPSEGLALPDFLLQCAAPLDVLRGSVAEFHHHDRRKSASRHESVFPPFGAAAGRRCFPVSSISASLS